MILGGNLTQNSVKFERKTRDKLRKSEPIRTNLNIGATNSNIAQLGSITHHIKNNLTEK